MPSADSRIWVETQADAELLFVLRSNARWQAMTNGGAVPDEPEPIEAEFEPTGEQEGPRKRSFAPPMRNRSIRLPELLMFSGAASVLGAVMAVVVTNANSGASTGTLAREIDALNRAQAELALRADQMSADVVTLRSKLDSQAEKLARQDVDEAALRSEIVAIAGQISALSGAGPGSGHPAASAVAANTPLGVLLSRINRLENVIADDASAPQKTRQLQRAFADMSERVDTLNEANTALTEALSKRQAALSALEAGLAAMSKEMEVVRRRALADQRIGEGLGIVRRSAALSTDIRPPEYAAEESKTIRALSSLETAAQRGAPFLSQQQILASLLPQDAAVADLQELARIGAPTAEALRRDFNVAARNAERIAAERTDDGWNWLRPATPAPDVRGGADVATADLIAEARRALDIDDIRLAVEQIDGITGAPAKAFRIWRADALRRAELDQRLQTLNQRLVDALADTSGGKDS